MKKLLVLLMVLGLATSAQAALTLSLSSTTVGIGGSVTLTINSSDTAAWLGDLVLSEDTVNWYAPVAADWDNTSIVTSGIGDLGYMYWESGYDNIVYRTSAAGSTVMPVAGNQFQVDIIGAQLGTLDISLQDVTSYAEISSNGPISLEVVPEPMTFALLGLGGLFLRRRK